VRSCSNAIMKGSKAASINGHGNSDGGKDSASRSEGTISSAKMTKIFGESASNGNKSNMNWSSYAIKAD